jgi:hypothetical protein
MGETGEAVPRVIVQDYRDGSFYKALVTVLEAGLGLATLSDLPVGLEYYMDGNRRRDGGFGVRGLSPYERGRIFKGPERFPLIGAIWLSNGLRGADERCAVVEVRGRQHLDTMRGIADRLAAAIRRDVVVRLIDEQQEKTWVMSDFDL